MLTHTYTNPGSSATTAIRYLMHLVNKQFSFKHLHLFILLPVLSTERVGETFRLYRE